jgi:lysophospholipase L1-like esterase
MRGIVRQRSSALSPLGAAIILAITGIAARRAAVAGDADVVPPRRILFLGNSITLHGPLPAIEWPNNHGMAASAPEKDYVHLLLRRFTEANHGRHPEAMIENIADFERHYDRMDVRKEYKKYADFKADVVILAIGENVRPLPTQKDKAGFKTAVAELLALVNRAVAPRILVRSSFWPNKDHDEILRQACAEAHGTFVDLGELGNDPSNRAASEQKFNYLKYPGVGGHPGDKGMAAIADAIWKAWQQQPKR